MKGQGVSDSPPDEPTNKPPQGNLEEIVAPLARAAVQKNKFNNRRWRALFGLLILAGAWLGWNNHNLNTVINRQHDTIIHESSLTTQDRALYCAQGAFLSQIIHASLANPQPNLNPQVATAIQGDLIHLDQTLNQVCN